MISFTPYESSEIPWQEIDTCCGANIFHTHEWFRFLEKTQDLTPVTVEIRRDGERVGYFQGGIVQKFGLKILGSPFRGWCTDFMGFNLYDAQCYPEVLKAFPKFAFKTLGCHYLEVVDPSVTEEHLKGLPYKVEILPRYVVDLTMSEDELFAAMDHSCRSNIRKAAKSGVRIEEAHDLEFAEDYYNQLTQVFAKQSLEVPYSRERLQQLLSELLPTGNILLLRGRNEEGACISTGVFLACNKIVCYWGAASLQEYQILRPNEASSWYGMRYWKEHGLKEFHFGGGWDQYKKKYGCFEVNVPRLMLARDPLVGKLTDTVLSTKSSRLRNWMIKHL